MNALSIFQSQEVHFTYVGWKRRHAPGLWSWSGSGEGVRRGSDFSELEQQKTEKEPEKVDFL